MNIQGKEIQFTDRPTHRSVLAAKGIMMKEILKLIDIEKVNPNEGVSSFMSTAIKENPELMAELSEVQSMVGLDQTIILATGLSYVELCMMKDVMYEDEYSALYKKSVEVLGGKTSKDFFDIYPTNTNFKVAAANPLMEKLQKEN